MHHTRQELITSIEAASREAFAGYLMRDYMRSVVGWKEVTARIKAVFGDLGVALGYMVAASGYPNATQGEWLYDLSWFSDVEKGYMGRLALALETEIRVGGGLRAADVDDDFMKLIQARADVRVWFTMLPTTEVFAIHLENCKKQASAFSGAQVGDAYVFMLYDWSTGATLVERWEVSTLG